MFWIPAYVILLGIAYFVFFRLSRWAEQDLTDLENDSEVVTGFWAGDYWIDTDDSDDSEVWP